MFFQINIEGFYIETVMVSVDWHRLSIETSSSMQIVANSLLHAMLTKMTAITWNREILVSKDADQCSVLTSLASRGENFKYLTIRPNVEYIAAR